MSLKGWKSLDWMAILWIRLVEARKIVLEWWEAWWSKRNVESGESEQTRESLSRIRFDFRFAVWFVPLSVHSQDQIHSTLRLYWILSLSPNHRNDSRVNDTTSSDPLLQHYHVKVALENKETDDTKSLHPQTRVSTFPFLEGPIVCNCTIVACCLLWFSHMNEFHFSFHSIQLDDSRFQIPFHIGHFHSDSPFRSLISPVSTHFHSKNSTFLHLFHSTTLSIPFLSFHHSKSTDPKTTTIHSLPRFRSPTPLLLPFPFPFLFPSLNHSLSLYFYFFSSTHFLHRLEIEVSSLRFRTYPPLSILDFPKEKPKAARQTTAPLCASKREAMESNTLRSDFARSLDR